MVTSQNISTPSNHKLTHYRQHTFWLGVGSFLGSAPSRISCSKAKTIFHTISPQNWTTHTLSLYPISSPPTLPHRGLEQICCAPLTRRNLLMSVSTGSVHIILRTLGRISYWTSLRTCPSSQTESPMPGIGTYRVSCSARGLYIDIQYVGSPNWKKCYWLGRILIIRPCWAARVRP